MLSESRCYRLLTFDHAGSLERLGQMVFSLIAVCLLTSAKSPCAAEPLSSVIPSEPITFDVPGIAIAKPIHAKPNQYSIKLAVSAMVHPDQEVFSKHWRLVVQPRDQRIRIVDYSPKTETTSALVGGVETKTTQEESRSIGLGATLSYSNFARAQSNTDRTSKESNSFTFQSKAVQQPRIASGTLDRGRGVHFKLARTSEQILDGEKEFEITLSVPEGWRTGLMDLTVIASGHQKKFDLHSVSWQKNSVNLKKQNFVVAIHRDQDAPAADAALTLANQERRIRSLANRSELEKIDVLPIPLLNDLRKRFEQMLTNNQYHDWAHRVVNDHLDPHTDKEVKELSIETRVAILDYIETREKFLELNTDSLKISKTSERNTDTSSRLTQPLDAM